MSKDNECIEIKLRTLIIIDYRNSSGSKNKTTDVLDLVFEDTSHD